MNAADLVKARRGKLVLLQERARTNSQKMQQIYAEQAKEIDKLLDELTQPLIHPIALKESLQKVIKSLFYDRPSQTVIDFLHRLKQFPVNVFEVGFNDFYFKVYLMERGKRKKISPRLLYAYLKVAMLHEKKQDRELSRGLIGDFDL